jgi:HEAT repeat protein
MIWWNTVLFKASGSTGRKHLLKNWARNGKTEYLPLILETLKDEDSNLQQTAIAALAHIPGQASINALGTLLKHPQVEIRTAAVTALGGLFDPKVCDLLVPSLADRSLEVQRATLTALQKLNWSPRSDIEDAYLNVGHGKFKAATFRGRAALEPLVAALHHELASFRREAAEALELIKDDKAVDPLLEAVRDSDITVRVAAVHSLGAQGGKRAVLALGILAKDEVQLVRLAVAEVLRKNWQPAHLNFITSMLKDTSYEVRLTAVEALGRSGDPQTAEPLISALKDPDKDVRQASAQALGGLRDRRAIEPLTLLLLDPDSGVRHTVETTLQMIDANWPVSEEARRTMPVLRNATNHDDYWVRQSAIRTLNLLSGIRTLSSGTPPHS